MRPKTHGNLVLAVTPKTFKAEVLSSSVPVLVEFWAPWCQPCRAVAPAMGRIARDYGPRARVVKVNAANWPELMERYDVKGLPTVALFHQGKLIRTVLGARTEVEYRSLLDDALRSRVKQLTGTHVVDLALPLRATS